MIFRGIYDCICPFGAGFQNGTAPQFIVPLWTRLLTSCSATEHQQPNLKKTLELPSIYALQ